jgi:hypothetical protein
MPKSVARLCNLPRACQLAIGQNLFHPAAVNRLLAGVNPANPANLGVLIGALPMPSGLELAFRDVATSPHVSQWIIPSRAQQDDIFP